MAESEARMGQVIQIGWCSGCRRRAKLVGGACAQCRSQFGPQCGVLMARIRGNLEFARFVYGRVPQESRDAFREMFGDPYARVD